MKLTPRLADKYISARELELRLRQELRRERTQMFKVGLYDAIELVNLTVRAAEVDFDPEAKPTLELVEFLR